MKVPSLVLLLTFISLTYVNGQQTVNLYNPALDGKIQLQEAVQQASQSQKHVLVQVGGNWCSWCVRFHNLCTTDTQIDSILKADFIIVKLNYSTENKNEAALHNLAYPNRFGYPVLVVLDSKGNRIHTQNSAYLEEGKGYNRDKVIEFLNQWSPKALKPETYGF